MNTVSSDPVAIEPNRFSLRSTSPRSRRGFWALIATQFQGAFSDNILRNLLLSMIVGMNLAKSERETFVSVVTFLFSVPFLILSMPGGWLADRFSKRQITIWTKVMEFGSMLLATAGLATHTLGAFAGRTDAGGEPGGAVRAVEIWPAAGAAAREEPVVGKRRHRAGNVSGNHHRNGCRRMDGRAFQRSRGVRGVCAAGSLGDRIPDQPRRRQSAGRGAGKTIPAEYRRRSVGANRENAQGPGAVSGGARQYLFLVSRLAALFDHRDLRARCAACRANQDRLPERDARRGHRHWQHGRRMGQRQQDRVRADSAGLDRHDLHRVWRSASRRMGWRDRRRCSECWASGRDSLPCR